MHETGVDGVTVARGAIGNPWIFKQAIALSKGLPLPPPPTLKEQSLVIRDHFDLCERTYSVQRAPMLMRKFCIKYSASHPDHEAVRLAFARLKTREEFESAIRQHYGVDGPGRYVPREVHGSQEEC